MGAADRTAGCGKKPVLPDTEIASKLYGCRKEAEEWYVICAGNEILDISREEQKNLLLRLLI